MTQSLEDYLETVSFLADEGPVRVTDIAERLSVSKPSVLSALKALQERGFVIHERYKHVRITEAGHKRAIQIREKHDFLTFFLREIVGVPEEIAEEEGCSMEHVISDETVEKLKVLVKRLEEAEKKKE